MAVMPLRRLSDERAPKVPHDCTVHELAKDGDVMYCISHVRAFALLEEGSTFGPGPTLTTRSGTGHEAFAVGGRLVGPSPMRPQAGRSRRGPPLNEEGLCLS